MVLQGIIPNKKVFFLKNTQKQYFEYAIFPLEWDFPWMILDFFCAPRLILLIGRPK